MRRVSFALIFALGVSELAHAAVDPAPAIDACIDRLFATERAVHANEPIEELLLICPELQGIGQSLDSRSFAPLKEEDLSLEELLDLRYSLRSDVPLAAKPRLETGRLQAIVKATLQIQPEKQPTLWERMEAWLREKLKGRGGARWLHFLEGFSMPEWLAKAILRGSVLLILLLALATVLNEMRWLPWRWQGFARKRLLRERSDEKAALSPEGEDFATMPPRAQGPALFRWILAQLAARRLVRPHAAYTHREQAGVIATDLPAIALPLRELALGAEQGIYAPTEPSEAEVEKWRDSARTITTILAEQTT